MRTVLLAMCLMLLPRANAVEQETPPFVVPTVSEVELILKELRGVRAKLERDPGAWDEALRKANELVTQFPDALVLDRNAADVGQEATAWGLGVYRSGAEFAAIELESIRATLAKQQSREAANVLLLAGIFEAQRAANLPTAAAATLARLEKALENPNNGNLHIDESEGVLALELLRKRLEAQIQARGAPNLAKQQAQLYEELFIQLESDDQNLRDEVVKKLIALGPAALEPAQAQLKKLEDTLDSNPDSKRNLRIAIEQIEALRPAALAGVKPQWNLLMATLFGTPRHGAYTPLAPVLAGCDRWLFLSGPEFTVCFDREKHDPREPQWLYNLNPVAGEFAHSPIGQPFTCTLEGQTLFTLRGALAPGDDSWLAGETKTTSQLEPNWIAALGERRDVKGSGVESGALLWSVEPGKDARAQINSKEDLAWLQNFFFCSAPTVVEGRAHVLGVRQIEGRREAWLLGINAVTGKLLWKTLLCSATPSVFAGDVQPALGLPVAVQGGTVYAVTNLGAAAAVDAVTGRVHWIRSYETISAEERQQLGRSSRFWAPNAPLVYDNVVVCTPQDSSTAFALDLATGRRIWKFDRTFEYPQDNRNEKLLYLLGVIKGRVVFSGLDVIFVQASTGKREARASFDGAGDLVGRGTIADGTVWVSTTKGFYRISLHPRATGNPALAIKLMPYPQPDESAGDLYYIEGLFYTVTPTRIHAFTPEPAQPK